MNTNRSGLLALARQPGYADDSSPWIWSGIFAAVSLLAFPNATRKRVACPTDQFETDPSAGEFFSG